MPVNVPDNPKVYTTTYDNFRGVDFTNDATNVWHRRSPTGLNMLPDEAGRPFKRHGWEILLSQEDLLGALSMFDYTIADDVDEDAFDAEKTKYYTEDSGVYTRCTEEDEYDPDETYYIRTYATSLTILKCSYFELAGKDHIVVFTNAGVIFYNQEDGVTAISASDADCYNAYDRCFFFEGNGTSAFYIYANFKVWRYSYAPTNPDAVGGFIFEKLESGDLTIPTVVYGASADGTGTIGEGYNLLGELASIEYNDNALKSWWCTDGIEITVPTSFPSTEGVYIWEHNGVSWNKVSGGTEITDSGITVSGVAEDGAAICVVYQNGVLLPNNVADTSKVEVRTSTSLQFDTILEVTESALSPADADTKCRLHQDLSVKKRAWIEFGKDWSAVNSWGTSGNDFIKVTFPSISIEETPFDDPSDPQLQFEGSAALLVEGV